MPAYELKESYSDFSGGGVMRRDATGQIDVGARLEEGGGYILTDDPAEVEVLDTFEPLKRAAVGDAEAAKEKVEARAAKKAEAAKKSDDK